MFIESKNNNLLSPKFDPSQEFLANEQLIYAQVLQLSPDPLVIQDADGVIVFASDPVFNMFGYQVAEIVGQPLGVIIDIDVTKPLDLHLTQSCNVGLPKPLNKIIEGIGKRKDGCVFYVEISQSVMMVPDGSYTLWFVRDGTKTRTFKKAISELNERHLFALGAANVGVWEWDLVSNVQVWSDEAFKLFGIQSSSLLATHDIWESAIHKDDKEGVNKAIEMALQGESRFELAYRVVWPSGEIRDLHSIAYISLSSVGKPLRITGVLRDVTAKNKKALKLKLKQQALMDSNQDLELFTFAASHDLNEPLRKIISFLDVLSVIVKAPADSEMDLVFKKISDAAARMQILISDLLKYSRVGRKAISIEIVNLNLLVSSILENTLSLVPLDDANIVVGTLPSIVGSRAVLHELFRNLIDNAVKFRRKGVPLELEIGSFSANGGWEIWVRDNGIGIDSKYIDTIFNLFTKLHGRGVYAGNGVGLAMCKRTLDKLGGKLLVESNLGTGSVFRITLPLNAFKLEEK